MSRSTRSEVRAGRAVSVVVVGVDGAGKSALVAALVDRLGGPSRTVHLHGRARILPRITSEAIGTVPEPHRQRPYAGILGQIKLAYLFVDTQLTWRVAIPRVLRGGSHVIVERGWWDIVVDPRRYRVSDRNLARALGGFVPRPRLQIVLCADARTLFDRKGELTIEELDRQQQVWRRLLQPGPGVLWLDAARPIDDLVAQALAAVLELAAEPSMSDGTTGSAASFAAPDWLALPPRSSTPRWWIPRAPSRWTHRGLRIHHPVSRKALVAWSIARLVARAGLLRILPTTSLPPLAGTVAHLVPPGATVAMARSWRRGRCHILILGSDDLPATLVKVAADAIGRADLAREGAMAQEVGPFLDGPVSTPRLLEIGDGYLVYEAVSWRPRWRAWSLPVEVAAALGRLYRAGARTPGGLGYAHGDFVPWNLLRTDGGWSLIDWEHARLDAPPFEDINHFLVQSCALLGRPDPDEIIAGIRGQGPLASVVSSYAAAAGVPAESAAASLGAYLRASLETLERRPGVQAESDIRRRLLRDLGDPGGVDRVRPA